MNIQVPTSITIDGVEHPVANFSEGVQRLVTIHTEWRTDLAKERLAVAKTEAAIRGLDVELSQLVASELAKSADTAVLSVTDDLTGGNGEAPSASVE